MRMPWPAAVAAVVVAAVGAAGLIRGAVPQTVSNGGTSSNASPPIVVSGAYVRQPAPPTDAAAAYFTVFNTTDKPDRLVSVASGAGATSILHTIVGGKMTAVANGVVIPAHGTLVLSTGKGHVMIEKLFGTLAPGQDVNLELSFAVAGPVEVSAPVIAMGAPVPTAPPSSGATK